MPSHSPSSSSSSSSLFSTNPHLLPLKLWYFTYFAAQFTQLFIPLILDRAMHFTPSTSAYMMASRRLVIFIVSPLFTSFCDATHLHRPVLIAAHLAYYFATFLLAQARSIPAVFVVLLVREAFVSGCEPAINNASIAKLAQYNTPTHAFGELRLWGSLGWGLGSFFASVLVDHVFHSEYIVALYIQIVMGIPVTILTIFYIDLSPDLFRSQAQKKFQSTVTPNPTPNPTPPTSSKPSAFQLYLSSPRALFCAANVLIQGLIFGVLQMTLFLYFAELGVSTSALGISVMLACCTEGLIFLFTPNIFAFCGGPQPTFNLGLFMSCAALLSFSLIHFSTHITFWFVLVAVFNGGTYAIFLTAALTITSDMAPPHLQTTAQGTLSALYAGIGPALGSAISGVAYRFTTTPILYCMLVVVQFIMLAVGRFVPSDPSSRQKTELLPLLQSSKRSGTNHADRTDLVRCVSPPSEDTMIDTRKRHMLPS